MIIEPQLEGKERDFVTFCRWLTEAAAGTDHQGQIEISSAREKLRSFASAFPTISELRLLLAGSVILDMATRGWRLRIHKKRVELEPPSAVFASSAETKAHIRRGHLLERDAQLRESSVREFIDRMEQRKLGPNGWDSIFSLMRDGRDLAEKLRGAAATTEPERISRLHEIISPYIQIAEPDVECEHTGLNLIDVWRYFRHTWVNAYKSLPGRSMAVLIRDAAAPKHPVIGIAALGSSMAQQQLRDRWIGWAPEVFLDRIVSDPHKLYQWTINSVDRLIDAIYQRDFMSGGVLSGGLVANPNEKVINHLLKIYESEMQKHRANPRAAAHKSTAAVDGVESIDWVARTRAHLFVAKRAKTLAQLLQIRMRLRKARFDAGNAATALQSADVRAALSQLVRMVKAEHVGVDMMDVVVCGAIAPYNALLGGKLVCLLLASPELVSSYNERYSRPSVIASSMKGAPVVRRPNLVLLATTSLYGIGSSQYNRVRVPLETVGGRSGESLTYVELGESRGYGSYQFSQLSLDFLGTLLGRLGYQKVNSIFGEGVNPLMRKIRDGLEEIGLPSEELLQHGNQRVVYAVPLARNFREVLVGLEEKPVYFLPTRRPRATSDALAAFWTHRWLSKRINNPEVLHAVERHSLSYPIVHGARVPLQHNEDD